LRGSRILIADDNLDMIYLIKKGFEGEGFTFIEAHDGDEAIKKIDHELPDLILLDLKMPRKHGLTVLKEIKKNDKLKDIPVIVLTVVSDENEKITALKSGASDFLLKPLITEELKARVHAHLKLRSATKALKDHSKKLEEIVEKKTEELRKYTSGLEEMVEEKVSVIKRQHEELLMSIQSAQKIQRSLLPNHMPEVGDIDILVRYLPSESVGGDFYDVFRIDENTLGLFIADVSGHGVPSAMVTVFLKQEVAYQAKRVLDNKGKYVVAEPKKVLSRLNNSFFRMNIGEGTFFVTIVYCIYSTKSREFICSLAGHHALPLIKRKGGNIETVEMSGFPIGWFENIDDFPQKHFVLERGDTVFLYTDGLFDIVPKKGTAADGGMFGPVIELLKNEDIGESFDSAINGYKKRNARLNDDVTMLTFRLRK